MVPDGRGVRMNSELAALRLAGYLPMIWPGLGGMMKGLFGNSCVGCVAGQYRGVTRETGRGTRPSHFHFLLSHALLCSVVTARCLISVLLSPRQHRDAIIEHKLCSPQPTPPLTSTDEFSHDELRPQHRLPAFVTG